MMKCIDPLTVIVMRQQGGIEKERNGFLMCRSRVVVHGVAHVSVCGPMGQRGKIPIPPCCSNTFIFNILFGPSLLCQSIG